MKELPHENKLVVQNILENPELTLSEKAKRIYKYSEMAMRKSKGPSGFGIPKMSENEIFMILVERAR